MPSRAGHQPAGLLLHGMPGSPLETAFNLCDTLRFHSLVPQIPPSCFSPNFPVGNVSWWGDSHPCPSLCFVFLCKSKQSGFILFHYILFCFVFVTILKKEKKKRNGRGIQFIIRGGAVFGLNPQHEICHKWILPNCWTECKFVMCQFFNRFTSLGSFCKSKACVISLTLSLKILFCNLLFKLCDRNA